MNLTNQLLVVVFCLMGSLTTAQINAKLFRYHDVSDQHITFVYGGDIWLMEKTGGTAYQLTHSPGEESFPKFSPDGQFIAYTASYNGNSDIYTIPVSGGMAHRVTYQSHYDRMVDWHPNGEHILFASARESGRQSYRQLYLVKKEGGFPEKLELPYGELASYSPDGKHLAYITKITENYPFKRYRGGLTSDILIYDLESNEVKNITNNEANDGKPNWVGEKVFFLSDQGDEVRLNIWEYNPSTGETKQITEFEDFDISYLSGNDTELLFEKGGSMFLMDASSYEIQPIEINIISDLSIELPRSKSVKDRISNFTVSPEGKRVIFEARGELFNVPAKDGFTKNITRSSGSFDRNPSWSPNGKWVAYWSDKGGEYEIYLHNTQSDTEDKKLTNRNKGYGYDLFWSPDNNHIAFIDETNTLYLADASSGNITEVDNMEWNIGHGGRHGFSVNWSSDSNWIAYDKGQENANSAIYVYDVASQQSHQLTSGFYDDSSPVFSTDGKYIFFLTDRTFNAMYSDMGDGTWIYPNATQVAAMPLQKKTESLMKTKNDEIKVKEDAQKEEKKEKEDKDKDVKSGEEASENKKDSSNTLSIDFEDIESRVEILPIDAGNIGVLIPFDKKLVYWRFANSGSSNRSNKLVLFDLEKLEEKDVISDVRSISLTGDGKAMIILSKGKYGLIKPAPGQKISDAISTDGLVMEWVPREEWNQIFNDTWRRHRDFFYDPAMHGLDWEEMRDRYGALLKDARTRWDVSFLQSNLAAELSAGHTYTRGGDNESVRPIQTGFLGIDFGLNGSQYKISRIVRPAEWDTEVRSPFDRPGVEVNVGDVIHSVNGVDLDPDKDPYANFEGLSGKVVSLKISSNGNLADAEEYIIKCLTQREEVQLRYLEWIENNRKMVDELSDGKLGYVYMSNTSGRGQLELVKMYYGQLDKKGFIIDERFNGGGQLADRFLELMQRPVVYNLHWRHGKDHTQPIKANTGPMGMLINGWAGSGGDGLPWAFQELEAGPIVGERTLGILVGPATGHQLIDGGGITVPGARLYDNDGHWFWEGEGVRPDIKVWDDPNIMMQGRDPQIERVVQEVMKQVNENSNGMTPVPAPEDRTAKGMQKN